MINRFTNYFLRLSPVFFLIVMVGLTGWACSDSRDTSDADEPMAVIGEYKVTGEEYLNTFRYTYERSGHALQVTRSLLHNILDQRVNFYSVVQYGVDRGWDQDYEGTYRKNLIYRQVMMDEFKRSIIEPRVSIGDEDLEDLFLRYNTHLRASHLYAPNREMAEKLYEKVSNGESFEKLASDIFQSSSLRNSGGDLGYFTVDEMDVGFEEAAYTLPIGEISPPVRTSSGFSIIKVTDRITSPIITEYQFAEKKESIRQLAIKQKTELERRSDMDRVIDAFRFNTELISDLWDKMEGRLDVDAVAGMEQDDFRSDIPEDWYSRVVGTYGDFDLTVDLFLQEVYFTPPEARKSINSEPGFHNLVEGVAYRSYAITFFQESQAYDHELIELSVENTFQQYLNRRLISSLKAQIEIPEEQVRHEFRQHPDVYTHPKEVNMAELAVRDMDTAEEAYNAIQSGMSFNDALMKYGFDEEAKLAGGEIGYTPVTHFGVIAPSLSDVRPGEVVGPFEMTSDVIFLFKCLGVREPHPMTFEEATPLIKEQLTETFVAEERQRIIRETMDKHDAKVHYDRIDKINLQL